MSGACDACMHRTWLLARLAGHLDVVRQRIDALLELPEGELIAAVAGRERRCVEREWRRVDVAELRREAARLRLELLCRCDPYYPGTLEDLAAPPAVLHIAGGRQRFADLLASEAVAVVGSRGASDYGRAVARSLGRSLSTAGLTVVSGLARGIDAAAHEGALNGGGQTVAVLPGPAHRAYPAGHRVLHRRIVAAGVAVSELGPGTPVRRWCFSARNRLIAALARMTVVVEAGEQSGSLVTATAASRLGRALGAVPGRVTSPSAAGPNALLAAGTAAVVRDAQDVLDHLYGVGARSVVAAERSTLTTRQAALLAAIAEEPHTHAAIARSRTPPEQALALLAELELGGWVRREAGGRFTVIP